jgi:hypothetical protein
MTKYWNVSRSKKKLTGKKIRYFIEDEKKASREYRDYGLYNLAKDERKHGKFLEKLSK